MAIRIENSLFLMVNDRLRSRDPARLLKHLAAKGKPENAGKRRRNRQQSGEKTGKEPAKNRQKNRQKNRHVICMNKGERNRSGR
jgi:hypothetical protein